jgi:hypothetical protein
MMAEGQGMSELGAAVAVDGSRVAGAAVVLGEYRPVLRAVVAGGALPGRDWLVRLDAVVGELLDAVAAEVVGGDGREVVSNG